MRLRNLMRLTMLVMLAGSYLMSASFASSQEAGLDAQMRANLAAIPLTAGDLPEGYALTGESFLTVDQAVSGELQAQQLTDAGFVGMYASVYQISGQPGRITSYVSVWNDADAAAAGFELLEDEAVTAPDASYSDAELDAGDGSAELTTGTEETDEGTLETTDATFVVDRYVTGIAVEATGDNAIDAEGIGSLVDAIESRVSTVAGGDAPEGINFSVATSTLQVASLGTEVQAGFLSPTEAEALYGVSGSSLGGLQTSWVSLVATGQDASAPFVVVGVSSFEDGETAARVVQQSADLIPLEVELQPVDDYSVDGADSVRGYQFVSPTTADAADANSFRAVAQSGDRVMVVDVQGADSADTAQTAATDLVTAQLSCGEGECQVPELSLGS